MSRQTTNYGLTKPDYTDTADIEVVNSNMDIIDEALKVIDTKAQNVMSKNSSAWSSTVTYAVGQYCIYNNSLWKSLVQHSGQTPQEGTYWTRVSLDTLGSEISALNSNLVYNYSNEHDIILSSGHTSLYTCYINTYEYVSSKIIHIMLNIQYDINYPTNVDIAYITAPTKKKKIPCMIKMNDIWICAYCICDTNGTITQDYTSSCRGIYIDTLLCIN